MPPKKPSGVDLGLTAQLNLIVDSGYKSVNNKIPVKIVKKDFSKILPQIGSRDVGL